MMVLLAPAHMHLAAVSPILIQNHHFLVQAMFQSSSSLRSHGLQFLAHAFPLPAIVCWFSFLSFLNISFQNILMFGLIMPH